MLVFRGHAGRCTTQVHKGTVHLQHRTPHHVEQGLELISIAALAQRIEDDFGSIASELHVLDADPRYGRTINKP